ncbi:MAG: hypothetical protein ACE5FY_05810 [Nitrospiria bacterium]
MRGDKIIVEAHLEKAAKKIVEIILPQIRSNDGKYSLSVAGESGSGKSEIATAIVSELETHGIQSLILQQDDYYVYPPRTNDLARRKDIHWVGIQEVRLDLLDQNLIAFLEGKSVIEKPLVIYNEDTITTERLAVKDARVVIADGTYTTCLKHLKTRTFIDRNYNDTRAHREKRNRHKSELDKFTSQVLKIEHEIVSKHKALADIIVTKEYEVERQ